MTLQPGPGPGQPEAGPRSPANPLGDWFPVTEDLGTRLAADGVSDGHLSSPQPRVPKTRHWKHWKHWNAALERAALKRAFSGPIPAGLPPTCR